MSRKKVLVTGIGGNVGQGIIRNIRSCTYDIDIVGCNVIDFSAGNHLCDTFYKVPYAFDAQYIPLIKDIVAREKIDLVIPSTDYEVYYLAQHAAEIGATVAASGINAAGIYLDKFLSFEHHQSHEIPFAQSFLPSQYHGQFAQCIAKPRKGRGSRGLHINPATWNDFSDEEYMIQELHKGSEITTAFYVNRKRELHGFISLLRYLDNGATSQCKVVTEWDAQIEPIIRQMIATTDIQGAANIQLIASDEGQVHPFEINCRISGTNSIRSNFGFKDVKYTLQEYLYNEAPEPPQIISGVAVRILMDVIYPDKQEFDQCLDRSANFTIF